MASSSDPSSEAIWQVVVVDGTEFPSMDGPLSNSSDPFVVLAHAEETEEFLQTGTTFRVRARTGVAQWNEVFKIKVPEDTLFLEVEVRDHDIHGSLRKGLSHNKEKENKFKYDYLRRIEINAEEVTLKDHLAKRMKESQVIGRGEVLLRNGFQTVVVFNRGQKRVGRLGISVTRLDAAGAAQAAGGEIRKTLSLPEAIHGDQAGPPIWAWLLLLAFATYFPTSAPLFRAISTAAIMSSLGVIAFRVWRCFVHNTGLGTIGFEEFKSLAPKIVMGVTKTSEQGLRHLFDSIDTDNSGALEPDELAAFAMRIVEDRATKVMDQTQMTSHVQSLRTKGGDLYAKHIKQAGDYNTTTGKAAIAASSVFFLGVTFWKFWLGGLLSV